MTTGAKFGNERGPGRDAYSYAQFCRFGEQLLDDEFHRRLQCDRSIDRSNRDALFIAFRHMKQRLDTVSLKLDPHSREIMPYDGRHLLADRMKYPQSGLPIVLLAVLSV
jgi:hypothetical protein